MVEEHCHICGKKSPLSFEHLPPRSALNSKKTELFGMIDWLKRESEEAKKGTQYQRGFGVKTLCNSCNNNTGAWYVPELSKLVHTGACMLNDIPQATLEQLNRSFDKMYGEFRIKGIRPLPIIKQIATMLLALNSIKFREKHSDLADFVLDKKATGLPDGYQFHLMFYVGPFMRYSGASTIGNTETGTVQLVTELAVPPFCYVLTMSDDICLSYGSINHYADFAYEEETELAVKMPVHVGNTPYPLDFRTASEVERDRKKAEATAPL